MKLTKLLVRSVLLVIGVMVGSTAFPATIYSVQNGAWTDPLTWGGTLPDLTRDSIVVGHTVTLWENITLEELARLSILEDGLLNEVGNKALNLEEGTALYNDGQVLIFKIKNAGTIFNTGLIDLGDDLINHGGVIYNDGMIYVKNLLTQGGMLSGNGGQYMIWNNLNSNGETIATCTGEPINICNPDGITDPCNGTGDFNPECVTICEQLLSLELLNFDASYREDLQTVELTWATTHEVGLDCYVVERTSAYETGWIAISPEIPARANIEDGVYDYTFIDPKPAMGINIYRLACRRIDGVTEYSRIETVEARMTSTVGIFPNPFATSVDVSGDLSGYSVIQIVGSTGQVLAVFNAVDRRQLALGFLEDGWYTVKIRGPKKPDLRFAIVKF